MKYVVIVFTYFGLSAPQPQATQAEWASAHPAAKRVDKGVPGRPAVYVQRETARMSAGTLKVVVWTQFRDGEWASTQIVPKCATKLAGCRSRIRAWLAELRDELGPPNCRWPYEEARSTWAADSVHSTMGGALGDFTVARRSQLLLCGAAADVSPQEALRIELLPDSLAHAQRVFPYLGIDVPDPTETQDAWSAGHPAARKMDETAGSKVEGRKLPKEYRYFVEHTSVTVDGEVVEARVTSWFHFGNWTSTRVDLLCRKRLKRKRCKKRVRDLARTLRGKLAPANCRYRDEQATMWGDSSVYLEVTDGGPLYLGRTPEFVVCETPGNTTDLK